MLFHTINRVTSWKCEGFRIKCLTVRISPNLTPKSSKPGAIPSTCHSEVKFLSFMWEKSVFMLPVERYSTDTNKSFRCTFCVNILFVLKSLHWPVGVKWWFSSCDGEVNAPRFFILKSHSVIERNFFFLFPVSDLEWFMKNLRKIQIQTSSLSAHVSFF